MNILEADLKQIIQEMEQLLEKELSIKNTDLIGICANSGLDLISKENKTHFVHELFETAINQSILKKYKGVNLTDRRCHPQILDNLTELLRICPPQSWRGEEQTRLQQFSTPPTIAFLMAAILGPKKDELIIEPSAGTGSLAVWLKIAGCRMLLNELSESRRILLEFQGFDSSSYDAEFLDDLLPAESRADGGLMNPPFSANAGRTKPGDSNFGFRHINSALARLKKGGRLVALFGSDALVKTQKGMIFLSEISENFDLKAIIQLPANAYYKYGTSLRVTILVIVKSEPQKPLIEVSKSNCSNLFEVLSVTDIYDKTND